MFDNDPVEKNLKTLKEIMKPQNLMDKQMKSTRYRRQFEHMSNLSKPTKKRIASDFFVRRARMIDKIKQIQMGMPIDSKSDMSHFPYDSDIYSNLPPISPSNFRFDYPIDIKRVQQSHNVTSLNFNKGLSSLRLPHMSSQPDTERIVQSQRNDRMKFNQIKMTNINSFR